MAFSHNSSLTHRSLDAASHACSHSSAGIAPASVRRICIPGRSGVSVNQCVECLFKDVFCGDGSETINVTSTGGVVFSHCRHCMTARCQFRNHDRKASSEVCCSGKSPSMTTTWPHRAGRLYDNRSASILICSGVSTRRYHPDAVSRYA